jgi:hypothetical protein
MSLRKSAVRRADAAHQAAVQTTTNAKAAPITISVFTPTIAMPRSALAARNQGHGCAAMRSIGAADLRDVTGRNVTFGAEARNKRLVLWLAGDARRMAVGRASVWLPPKSLNRSGDSSVKLELVATRRATGPRVAVAGSGRGSEPSITKTERRRSANLLQMPRGAS